MLNLQIVKDVKILDSSQVEIGNVMNAIIFYVKIVMEYTNQKEKIEKKLKSENKMLKEER